MISKKELLKEMGISYGQLYRWKREGLIPEGWFVKQAATTGQETYFERELIIPRIEKILELKDKYQLEELKQFFKPSENDNKITVRDAVLINEIDPYILRRYINQRENYRISFIELAIIYIFSTNQDIISYDDFQECDFSTVTNPNLIFYILANEQQNHYVIMTDRGSYLDNKLKILREIKLDYVVGLIARKFKEDN